MTCSKSGVISPNILMVYSQGNFNSDSLSVVLSFIIEPVYYIVIQNAAGKSSLLQPKNGLAMTNADDSYYPNFYLIFHRYRMKRICEYSVSQYQSCGEKIRLFHRYLTQLMAWSQ